MLKAFLSIVCLLSAGVRGFAVERPNFILIMADDMGFSDIGCYGGEIDTPNLDRMAEEGMKFTRFYNNAKCTTTRASILTGMYPRGNGDSIPKTIPTVGEVMKGAGYRTALMGKWHLGSKAPQRPFDRGFDEFYGLMDGCCNFFDPSRPDPEFKGGKVRVFGRNDELITDFPEGYYTTDAFAEEAIGAMRKFHAEGKPFFLHLAFTAPHYPLHAPAEDIAKYRGKYKMGWEELRKQRHKRQIELGIVEEKWGLSPTDKKAYDWEEADQDWEDLRMATYAAMVDRMDRRIGDVMAALKEMGIDDNTVVMFLSDNGGCSEEPGGRDTSQQPGSEETYTAVGPAWGWAQNTPFRRYKSWVNEGGISTPLIVRWPGKVKAGSMTGEAGHIIDIVPTIMEAAGTKYPAEFSGKATEPVEGLSFLTVLEGQEREGHDRVFWEWSGNKAVMEGKWKLVWDTLEKPKRWQLFDIEADRTEMNDLAEKMPGKVDGMKASYDGWAGRTGRRRQ